jgi:calcineurin-like phosphoesterase
MVKRFLDSMPTKFEVAIGDVRINGIIADIDDATGRARSITRVRVP